MQSCGRSTTVFLIVALALIQCAYGIQVTASGGINDDSGTVSMNLDILKSTSVSSQMAISGATVTPYAAAIGPVAKFEQTHSVKDASGKSASVYVKVLNAPNGLTYSSKVLPKEGSVTTQTQVSAEQWLTVPKASTIKCTATASYGTTRSASVGLEEYKGTVAGDYVTLKGYYGRALTTGTSVLSSQTATSGAANSIKIYGSAKESSGTYKADTPLKGISSGKATFSGLSETASAGTTTQVVQKEHVHGTFTSTATHKPTAGTAQTKTRTSNYGTEYDINMKAAKGSLPAGTVGYYVKTGTTASKIQGAVNAAQSGDTINAAAGKYVENVKIDKSLIIKGAGSTKTIVDGNMKGSVFTIGMNNPNAYVTLSDLGITAGSGTPVGPRTYNINGGGVYNKGRTTIKNCRIFSNSAYDGGGIYNDGTATISSSIISGNKAVIGGGISNSGTATISGSTISGNEAGGISNTGTIKITSSTITGNSAGANGGGVFNSGTASIAGSTISGNKACYGGGIYNTGPEGKLTVTGSTISENSCDAYGGGVDNWAGGEVTITGSIISGNSAGIYGGGIYNSGSLIINSGSYIFANIADLEASGVAKGGGIYREEGMSILVFKDQYGNIITNPNVINSIVYDNHLQSNTGPLSNIE